MIETIPAAPAESGRGTRSNKRRWAVVGASALVLGAIGGWFVFQGASESRASLAPLQPAKIDGNRAIGYLKTICDFGNRPAGSEANARQKAYVAEHFKKFGGVIREQKFATRHPVDGKRVDMANLVGSWFPDRLERVVLAAHYDSRPFPDMEDDPARRRDLFIAANDGASGVALLMEIAQHLNDTPTPWGVDLVLLDGEELVFGRTRQDTIGEYFLGSKEFGRLYSASRRRRGTPRYVAGFVLDMIGDKDLVIDKEPMSLKLAGRLVSQVWDVAERLDPPATAFRNNIGQEVLDDHLPMNDAGIPTIDLIDFDYPFWHRAGDTPDKCSAESLEQVGRVLTAWLAQPKPAAPTRKVRNEED